MDPIGTSRRLARGVGPAKGMRPRRARNRWGPLAACTVLLSVLCSPAAAHVRWFSHATAADASPVAPLKLIGSPGFLVLLLLTLGVLAVVRVVDARLARSPAGPTMHTLADLDEAMAPAAAARVLRAGLALFFAAIALYFADAPITLTPELKSPSALVGPLQLLIALALLVPAGVIPACIGMLVLYGYSAQLYGIVHLVDYHQFLGMVGFLVLASLSARKGAALGMLVLRVMVATSFLWVGIEKWVYPEWTCDILEHRLPMLTMGVEPDRVTMAAGFVEVALAFLMLFGGVSSQVASATLLLMLTAAIPVAGVVDAIGHLPMLFVLFILATTRNRLPRWLDGYASWTPVDLCKLFLLGVAGVLGLYFLAHASAPARNARAIDAWPDVLLAMAATFALAGWVTRMVMIKWDGWVRGRAAER